MIELHSETLIALAEVPKHLPGRPHISSIYRWCNRNRRPLETVKIGGRVYTSIEALDRFAEQRSGPNEQAAPKQSRTQAIARANAALDAAGV